MLKINQLAGFGAGGKVPAEISFIGYTENATQQTTYTFNNVAIGAADPTRRVIVGIYWGESVAHRTITACTINGVSVLPAHVTVVASSLNAGDIAIVSALVPTGTTANIVVTMSSSAASLKMGIAVYRAINESVTTPHDTMSDNVLSGNQLSDTINVPNNGWVLGISTFFGTSVSDMTWTGVTEQFDQIRATGAAARSSGALINFLPAETARAITVTGNGTSPTGGLAGISWG